MTEITIYKSMEIVLTVGDNWTESGDSLYALHDEVRNKAIPFYSKTAIELAEKICNHEGYDIVKREPIIKPSPPAKIDEVTAHDLDKWAKESE